MSNTTFLFVKYDYGESCFTEQASWVTESSESELKLHQGIISDVAGFIKDRTIVVLPGEMVSCFETVIPGNSREKVLKAIPYALEESLVDDVEELHFAINKINDIENTYQVMVINKSILTELLEKLAQHHISTDAVIPDYLLWQEQDSAVRINDRILVNQPELKLSCPESTYQTLMAMPALPAAKDAEGIAEITLIKSNQGRGDISSEYNLLQGQYKKVKSWSSAVKTWTPVAALLLIWLIVEGAMFSIDYLRLDKQNKELNASINKIYRATFPSATRVVDARAQMQQKLNELKKRKGSGGQGFTEMLTGSAEIFSSTNGLSIRSMRYQDGRLSLELNLASLQDLDGLKQKLTNSLGYRVEIQNASSEKDQVSARIQILGATS